MKKLLLLSIMLGVAFTSCKKEPIYSIELDKSVVIIPASGGSDVVDVTANAQWSVLIDEDGKDWITVSPVESHAIAAELTITVETPNTTEGKLESHVRVVNGDNIRAITVIQEALNVDVEDVYGTWKITECPESPGMVNSVFVFNSDNSCTAEMMGQNINATYTFQGNIINIAAGQSGVPIAIQTISETEMTSIVMGRYNAKLIKM